MTNTYLWEEKSVLDPPVVVHLGQAADLLARRQSVQAAAFQAHPKRFVRRSHKPPALPTGSTSRLPTKSSLNFFPLRLTFIDTYR